MTDSTPNNPDRWLNWTPTTGEFSKRPRSRTDSADTGPVVSSVSPYSGGFRKDARDWLNWTPTQSETSKPSQSRADSADSDPSGGLLNLPAIEAAPAVYLTASLEDAEAVERLGRVATTLEGGAWEADGWTEPLRGKTVALIDPQRSFSHLALTALRGVVKQVFVVDLPADSVTAWIGQGGDRNELMELTKRAWARTK